MANDSQTLTKAHLGSRRMYEKRVIATSFVLGLLAFAREVHRRRLLRSGCKFLFRLWSETRRGSYQVQRLLGRPARHDRGTQLFPADCTRPSSPTVRRSPGSHSSSELVFANLEQLQTCLS